MANVLMLQIKMYGFYGRNQIKCSGYLNSGKSKCLIFWLSVKFILARGY